MAIQPFCQRCFDALGCKIACYCARVENPRSNLIEHRDDYWVVRFDDSITVEVDIMNWVNDNVKPRRWFIKNYCSLGFYDRGDAVLCHLRFA